MINSSWKKMRIGDLVNAGFLFVSDGYRMKNEELRIAGIPFIRGGDIGFGWIDTSVRDHIREDFRERLQSKLSQPGDTAFITKGTVGRAGFLREGQPQVVFAPQVSFWRSLDHSILEPRFLYYLICSPSFQAALDADKTHGAMVADYVSLTQQFDFQFLFPAICEQSAIASILGALDDKIELNRRMNETLEAMARAIFKDWFVDFGPTRAKMAMRGETPRTAGDEGEAQQQAAVARAPYLAPHIWSLFPDRLDEEGKPEGWREMPLSAFFDIIGGGTPKTSVADYWNGEIPWFSVVDAPLDGSCFVHDTEKHITSRGAEESAVRTIPPGTTIISARGTVGKIAVAAREMTFNQSCYALRGKSGIGNWFVYLFARHMVSRLQSLAHGSVFSTITRQTFDAIPFWMASLEIFSHFESVAGPLFDKQKANSAEARTLAATRDLLLPKLMSGEIRIKDTEKIVEDAV